MTLFLIGPSAGYFDGNRKGFTEAAGTLRGQGAQIISPLDVTDVSDDPRDVFRALLDSDRVMLLPGWDRDAQARLLAELADAAGIARCG
jgi:hypothetical protein